jgi:sugar O-acyltransferase (sialic acid O-acetyltransferase NeuD family)
MPLLDEHFLCGFGGSMMRNKLIIFGLGEQADVANYYFTNHTSYDVVAFTVDDEYSGGQSLKRGIPVVPLSNISAVYPPDQCKAFIALGYSKMNLLRKEKFHEMKARDYEFASYISAKANNFSERIGENCFILENNTIQPFVEIGDNVTLWSGNHIGHHSKIKSNCFITSHVVVSGGCLIGERTFIGVNSTLRDHIKIGEANMIGAGSLILSDTEDNSVYASRMSEKSRVPSNRISRI